MSTIEFLRQLRMGGYAIFDFLVSFVGIYLLSPLLTKFFLKLKINVPKNNWLFLTLPMSILIHFLSGEITIMTRDFLDPSGHFILKIIILVLLVFGLRGIKIVK